MAKIQLNGAPFEIEVGLNLNHLLDKLEISKPYDIEMHQYMNLISFYGLPEDHSVSVVMSGIDNPEYLDFVIGEEK